MLEELKCDMELINIYIQYNCKLKCDKEIIDMCRPIYCHCKLNSLEQIKYLFVEHYIFLE